MSETSIVHRSASGLALPEYDSDRITTIKRTLMPPNATDAELQLFIEYAKRTGLDPFVGHLYATKDKSGKFKVITGIDGLRLIAQRTGEFDGYDGPYFRAKGGDWSEVWDEAAPPYEAKITVFRAGSTHGFPGRAKFEHFKRDTPAWRQYPDHMTALAAERHALRKAFARETAGLYVSDEGSSEVTVGEDVPISRGALSTLHILSKQLGWSDVERHEAAGVRSFLDLSDRQARTLADEWSVLAYPNPSVRASTQGRLAAGELTGQPALIESVEADKSVPARAQEAADTDASMQPLSGRDDGTASTEPSDEAESERSGVLLGRDIANPPAPPLGSGPESLSEAVDDGIDSSDVLAPEAVVEAGEGGEGDSGPDGSIEGGPVQEVVTPSSPDHQALIGQAMSRHGGSIGARKAWGRMTGKKVLPLLSEMSDDDLVGLCEEPVVQE